MTEHTGQKLGIDWLKTIGGALAAVSAALLLSTLGAAGTIIGAALGSVVATVGGALYSQGLARSHERLAQASRAARRNVGVAQTEVQRAIQQPGAIGDADLTRADLTRAEESLGEAQDDLAAVVDEPAEPTWRDRFVLLPWKRIALTAAALFAVTLLAITVFELVAGRTVSSITGGTDGKGGTTITHIGRSTGHSGGPSPTEPTSPAGPTTTGPVGPSAGPVTAVPSPTTSPTTSAPTTTPTSPTTTTSPVTTGPTGAPTTP